MQGCFWTDHDITLPAEPPLLRTKVEGFGELGENTFPARFPLAHHMHKSGAGRDLGGSPGNTTRPGGEGI